MATLGARVSNEFYDRVVAAAQAEGVKVSGFIERAVTARMEKGPEKDPNQLEMRLPIPKEDADNNRQ